MCHHWYIRLRCVTVPSLTNVCISTFTQNVMIKSVTLKSSPNLRDILLFLKVNTSITCMRHFWVSVQSGYILTQLKLNYGTHVLAVNFCLLGGSEVVRACGALWWTRLDTKNEERKKNINMRNWTTGWCEWKMMTKVIKRGLSLVNDEGEFKKW